MESGDGRSIDPAKVAALIPAFLEEAHIADVVRRTRKCLPHVFVVDDGSPDETGARARAAGAEVISHPRNLGKGAAIKTGLREVLKREFDYAVLLDGDGQHLPEEIGRFLSAGAEHNAGIFIGNRMVDTTGMPPVRLLTNRFMSWQIGLLCGCRVPDSQCGFRMLRRDVIPDFFCESNAYDYETEMILVAGRAGHRIISVPVTTVYGDEQSKIRAFQDSYRFFRLMARYWRK